MEKSPGKPVMITVDIKPCPKVAAIHQVILKNALNLNCSDMDCAKPIGLVFYDCHSYWIQMKVHQLLFDMKMISDGTIVALHDTGVWPAAKAGISGCNHGEKRPGR